MSEPFIAQVTQFPLTFAPRFWAWCGGGILPISQNTALFSLVGTAWGGDGRTTFGLPNLLGRAPMGAGQGTGLSYHPWGAPSGVENVALDTTEIPSHNHTAYMEKELADTPSPTNGVLGFYSSNSGGVRLYKKNSVTDGSTLSANSLADTGGGQAHPNCQPWLAVNFCIALEGIYPARN